MAVKSSQIPSLLYKPKKTCAKKRVFFGGDQKAPKSSPSSKAVFLPEAHPKPPGRNPFRHPSSGIWDPQRKMKAQRPTGESLSKGPASQENLSRRRAEEDTKKGTRKSQVFITGCVLLSDRLINRFDQAFRLKNISTSPKRSGPPVFFGFTTVNASCKYGDLGLLRSCWDTLHRQQSSGFRTSPPMSPV